MAKKWTPEEIALMFGSMAPGTGGEFMTFAGSGQVDQGAQDFINSARNKDWNSFLTNQVTPGGFTTVNANDPNPWLGGAGIWRTGTDSDNAGGGGLWNQMNDVTSGNFDPNQYQYVRQDPSRVEEGLYMRDYYDGGGKHSKSEILNDPTSIGKFTSGDLGMIISGLAAMGGVAALGAGMTAAGAGGAAQGGAVGSGAGFVGEGAASGIGAWDGALAGATAGDLGAAGAGGLSAVDLTGTGLPLDSSGSVIGSTAGTGTSMTNAEIMNMINGGGFVTPGTTGTGTGTGTGTTGTGTSGGGLLSGSGLNIPGLGNVGWADVLKYGSLVLGGLAGGQGNEQTSTSTRELPDYLRGPVTGPNGLLSSADSLMQHQLYGSPMRRRT